MEIISGIILFLLLVDILVQVVFFYLYFKSDVKNMKTKDVWTLIFINFIFALIVAYFIFSKEEDREESKNEKGEEHREMGFEGKRRKFLDKKRGTKQDIPRETNVFYDNVDKKKDKQNNYYMNIINSKEEMKEEVHNNEGVVEMEEEEDYSSEE
jgi:hypothetical protein